MVQESQTYSAVRTPSCCINNSKILTLSILAVDNAECMTTGISSSVMYLLPIDKALLSSLVVLLPFLDLLYSLCVCSLPSWDGCVQPCNHKSLYSINWYIHISKFVNYKKSLIQTPVILNHSQNLNFILRTFFNYHSSYTKLKYTNRI